MPDLSPHFSKSELCCKCGCNLCLVSPRLVIAMEALRSLGPEPIVVHDGYRCAAHNAAVGGVKNSQHETGEAFDGVIQGLGLQEMYDRAIQIPDFASGGIGLYPDGTPFIHCDVRPGRARWCRKGGVYLDIATAGVKL